MVPFPSPKSLLETLLYKWAKFINELLLFRCMGKNPDSIDEFLKDLGKRLGVDVDPSTKEQSEKQPDTHSIMVQVHSLSSADKKIEYYINSYILGQVEVSDLKGQLVEGSIAMKVDSRTLQDVCNKIEQNLDLFDTDVPRLP